MLSIFCYPYTKHMNLFFEKGWKMMKDAVRMLPEEVKNKLIALDRNTSQLYELPFSDPGYLELHDICRSLQEDLIFVHGLTPRQINEYTYGDGGLLIE